MSSRSFTLHGPPANHAADPPSEQPGDANQSMTFDIVDAHGLIRNLSIQSQRLSRQFQKSLAALLKLHKHKGMHFEPPILASFFQKRKSSASPIAHASPSRRPRIGALRDACK